jgi:iron(II)-dependent oxidoreductase
MVKVPSGQFQMGTADPMAPTDEMPLHAVEVDSFWMAIHPVTNGEFQRFLDETGYVPEDREGYLLHWGGDACPPEIADHPVVHVSYHDAEAYLEWAGARLPTEAEWEKASTWDDDAGRKRRFPWGDEEDPSRAHVQAETTAPVGSHPLGTTPDGIADLYGNVWEWTSTWYGPYPENLDENPDYGEKKKVCRGVSYHPGEVQFGCTTRNPRRPTTRSPLIGFRAAE